jgi:hypothetical protein
MYWVVIQPPRIINQRHFLKLLIEEIYSHHPPSTLKTPSGTLAWLAGKSNFQW